MRRRLTFAPSRSVETVRQRGVDELDPYIKATLLPYNESKECDPDVDAGHNPNWTSKHKNVLRLTVRDTRSTCRSRSLARSLPLAASTAPPLAAGVVSQTAALCCVLQVTKKMAAGFGAGVEPHLKLQAYDEDIGAASHFSDFRKNAKRMCELPLDHANLPLKTRAKHRGHGQVATTS